MEYMGLAEDLPALIDIFFIKSTTYFIWKTRFDYFLRTGMVQII